MGTKAKGAKEHGIRIEAGRVGSTVEVGGRRQTGLGSGDAKEVENLLLAVQRLGAPVLGDFGKQLPGC